MSGGSGGSKEGLDGGFGGSGYSGQAGGEGASQNGFGTGGGGGGAGGGAGGTGGLDQSQGSGDGGDGGIGGLNGNGSGSSVQNAGSLTGTDGGAGESVSGAGGGGGGGAGGYGAASTDTAGAAVTNASTLQGGSGGAGGAGSNAGNGGDGGAGVLFTAASITFTNAGTIKGGNGGTGGGGSGGSGGAGGDGVAFTSRGQTVINSGTIQAGNGGSIGNSSGTAGTAGTGIVGAGLSIINSGTIEGGLSGDDVRGYAVQFTGGLVANSLTITSTASFVGSVVAYGYADTLALGGGTNGTFDLSQMAAKSVTTAEYRGFGTLAKIGSTTWTLSHTTAQRPNYRILGGTLDLAGMTQLVKSLTLDGGSAIANGVLSSSSNMDLVHGNVLATLTGNGSVYVPSGGSVTIQTAATYTGATNISAGAVLRLAATAPLERTSGIADDGTLRLIGTTVDAQISGNGTLYGYGTVSSQIFKGLSISASGGTLKFAGSDNYFGSVITGSGSVEISGNSTIGAGGKVSVANLTVDDHATLTLGANLSYGNHLSVPGDLDVNSHTLTLTDIMDLNSGLVAGTTGALYVTTSAELTSEGTSTIGSIIKNNGSVDITSGTLDLTNTVRGTGSLDLDGGQLEIGGYINATQTVDFAVGVDSTLLLDDYRSFRGTIAGFAVGDTIDLASVPDINSYSYSENAAHNGGILKVYGNPGTRAVQLTLAGHYTAAQFHFDDSSGTHTNITLASAHA